MSRAECVLFLAHWLRKLSCNPILDLRDYENGDTEAVQELDNDEASDIRSRKPTRKRAERARGGVSKRNKVRISGQDIKQMNTRLFNHNPSYDMADCRLRPYLSYASSRSPTLHPLLGKVVILAGERTPSRGEMITIR